MSGNNEGRKCFRKGGRRKLENTYQIESDEHGYVPSKRASQFAVFAALRGYSDMLEVARRDAAEKYADK